MKTTIILPDGVSLKDAFRKNFPNHSSELDDAGFLDEVCEALEYLTYADNF